MIANSAANRSDPTDSRTIGAAQILVVDDDPVQLGLLRQILSPSHKIQAAGSAQDAIDAARTCRPDLVIMDYSMPGMTGIEGMTRLREIHPRLPVVMLTGMADIEIARRAIQAGAAEFVLKPFAGADLLSVVARLAPGRSPADRALRQTPATPSSLQRRVAGGIDLWRGRLPTVPSENRVLATLDASCHVEAKILRLSRGVVHAEIYDPNIEFASAHPIARLQVWVGGEPVFDGSAEIGKVVSTGVTRICEFVMHGDWATGAGEKPVQLNGNLEEATRGFIERWRETGRIRPEFMLAVAAAAAFLGELRGWLEGLEITWHHDESEREVLEQLLAVVTPVLNEVMAPFEAEAARVPEPLMGIHAEHLRSVLHPLVLCAPFVHRCFVKPLGYPGDFGVMNRMLDDPFEGEGLFARILNAWVIRSGAGDAYRHRVHFLENVLREEGARVLGEPGRVCRVLSLGCGAAREVQHFVASDPCSERVSFTLLDFNPETVRHARERVEAAAAAAGRSARVTAVEFSVHQMLAAGARLGAGGEGRRPGFLKPEGFDVVYCAGLFDYLSDRVCRRLIEIFWDLAAPGGTIVACNFAPANPIRGFMDYVLDWRLIYRTSQQLRALAIADALNPDTRSASAPGGVETFVKIRKPGIGLKPPAQIADAAPCSAH